MRLHPHSLFPNHQFRIENLDLLVARHIPREHRINPALKQELFNTLHKSGIISYGGYGEDRSTMWKGTYMEQTGAFTHLGVDVNVRHKTPIQLPFETRVIDSRIFTDLDVGWGPRLILETSHPANPLIILGHLSSPLPQQNTILPANVPFATVGTYPSNGNVFEHLHIQLVARTTPLNVLTLDGYGQPSELPLYPDPFNTNFVV